MSILEDKRLMIKIAHMYYEEGVKQSDIARSFGVSRPMISKYLSKAKEQGIVQIIIHDEDIHPFMALEAKLERQFNLKEVVCVSSTDNDSIKSRLGEAASNYLLRMLNGNESIGVSSGTTLNQVAVAMQVNKHYPDVSFVPLVAGMGDERVDIHSNSIVARLAENLGAHFKLLHAPVLVDSKEAKDIIRNQSTIKSVFDTAHHANIALVGIGGTPQHSTMVKSYLNNKNEFVDYQGIVGDICYNFIDENGQAVNHPWNERVINIDLESLKQIDLVIGVASGKEKEQAIRAALKGDLIDVLVTDDDTAETLLFRK
ncbi:sorbitol operon regulator [Paraliobacillus ryukyuensis]|uniref:DNA-binding transcriptional regulator LsrR (DeoR family) n=1 Tax=Paraliobacillus ryukyuensis TaxID=200904 RepID=A0A366EFY1_9BACI|nr:sugar-binding transcriptional regulator [Paraliobacillus ryukyuensis]RBP00650.1 DNA-binding transcriptional regulator LsrR (DeoR family) [Paraliobacillus ryukyuensis]